jgi:hypothetical protein
MLPLAARASSASDPLDLIPPSSRVVVVADSPRKLAEAVTGFAPFQDAQKLGPVLELLETSDAKRAFQLLKFAEFGLGAKWPELLDQLGGRGIALGIGSGDDAPAVLVMSGTNEKQVARAFGLAVKLAEDELARQGAKDAITRGTVGGVETLAVGGELHFARAGAVVLASNTADGLKAALARAGAGNPKPHPARAAALGILPKNPLAWVWLDFAAVRQTQEAKDFFDATRKDFLQTVVAGATIDCLGRSDFVAAGLYHEPNGFRLAVRLPAGRDGMWEELKLHVPPKGTAGSLPLLDPPGTIYTHSLHLDAAYFWKNRDRLVNEQTLKDIEEGEKQISRFLPSRAKLGELLEMWGPYHRVVVANHDTRPYKTEPGLKLPAFGYVATARDPKFGPDLAPVLRSAGVVASLQFGLKMVEHDHEGVKVVAYRFPENKPLADDPENLRFNFEPCFAVVGDEVVVASTVELGKKLITELKKPRPAGATSAVVRGKFAVKAAADALGEVADPLVTDAILGRGLGLAEAKKEIAALVAFVKTLGTVGVELDVTDTEYRVDVVWNIK